LAAGAQRGGRGCGATTIAAIVVDASVMVAFLTEADVHHNAAIAWLDDRLMSGDILIAPTILIAEVAAATGRAMNREAGERAIRWLASAGFIELEPVSNELAQSAAKTAVAQGLKGCDSIYVELAIRTREPW